MILFNAGYDRLKKEPFYLTIHGMEYDVETHLDTATFTSADFNKFINTLIETKKHFLRHQN